MGRGRRGGLSKELARTLESPNHASQQRGQQGRGREEPPVRGCRNVAEKASSLNSGDSYGTASQPLVWSSGGDANGGSGGNGDRRGRRQGGGVATAAESTGMLVAEVVRDDVRSRRAKIRAEADEARRADRDSDPRRSGARHRKAQAVSGLKLASPPLPLAGLELTSPPSPQRRPRSSSSTPDGQGRWFSPTYRWHSSSPRQPWIRTPSPSVGAWRTGSGECGSGQGYDHGAFMHIGGSCRHVHDFVDEAAFVDTDGACGGNRYGNSALKHGFYHEVLRGRRM
eukprot:TRINITY_DN42573_c0_g1_i1.p1 TRINITY_DN42573_c0_g1~~TRINITY_DN42573_c0_g1_i1.p1  ORF type:complete len:283 (-),score=53.87 TRINITY_DN42573_c0_g1_i1:44-892(-)